MALPFELQERLEKTTAFRTRLEEEEKNHNFSLQQIKNTHAQKYACSRLCYNLLSIEVIFWSNAARLFGYFDRMAEIKQKVRIDSQRLDAEAKRYEVEMDENVSVAESARKVKVENSKGQMEVAVTKAKGMIEVAHYQGKCGIEVNLSILDLPGFRIPSNFYSEYRSTMGESYARKRYHRTSGF